MKENQKKQSFGDILAAFEKMEKEAKTEKNTKKSLGITSYSMPIHFTFRLQ